MKKIFSIVFVLAFIAFVVSCQKNITTPTGTVYLNLPAQTLSYFNNGFTGDTSLNHKATLGRVLFYDGHLSVNNTIACASCHKQTNNFADIGAFSTGFEGKLTKRNSRGILNIVAPNSFFTNDVITNQSFSLFWDGRENSLINLIERPITNHVEMGIDNTDKLPAKLAALSFYPPLFMRAYGTETITSTKISECISIFLASISSLNSRFDQFNAGKLTAMNALEKHGKDLFTSTYNCAGCHDVQTHNYGSTTISDFRDIGLDQNYTDFGRGNITLNPSDNGKFIVPNLRNVALTAPYMHDGRYNTLDEVLEHYSHNILSSPNLDTLLRNGTKPKTLNISAEDKIALIAFLNTLTDYTTITDPKFANPFKTN